MTHKIVVDLPSGWRYGFPRAIDIEVWKDPDQFRQLLKDSGYDEDKLDFARSYVRCWPYPGEETI